jgi:hypothetical protein
MNAWTCYDGMMINGATLGKRISAYIEKTRLGLKIHTIVIMIQRSELLRVPLCLRRNTWIYP